jgi:hypothetical protein
MKRIVQMIEGKKAELEKGRLFEWLRDETVPGRERMSFAPAMLTYLMGFKDVLDELRRPDARDELDRQINAYCGEDAEHWRWYLRDLEKLGYSLDSWGSSLSELCNEVWSPATRINRSIIFRLVERSHASKDPLLAMVLIQVFEATGVVFIAHTRGAARAMGLEQELLYFGRVHYEEEFGHSVQAKDLLHHDLGPERRAVAARSVDELFSLYGELFDCWYQHRRKYATTAPAAPERYAA